ncbi:hypothetical protein ACOMHN_012823 [Nucella lapillus]
MAQHDLNHNHPPLLLLLFILTALPGIFAQEIRVSLKEEQPAATFVGSLADSNWLSAAVAQDARASLRYTLLTSGISHADLFTINATTGVVRTSGPLDRETLCGLYSPVCELKLEAAAQSSLTQFFRMVTLVIEVEDVNDHAPRFPKPVVRLEVSEDAAVNKTLALSAAEDQDTGRNGVQGYSLAGPPGTPFAISVTQAQDGRQKVTLEKISLHSDLSGEEASWTFRSSFGISKSWIAMGWGDLPTKGGGGGSPLKVYIIMN